MSEVRLVHLVPPHNVEDMSDSEEHYKLHKRVRATVTLHPNNVSVIHAGKQMQFDLPERDIYVYAVAPDDTIGHITGSAKVIDKPKLHETILSLGMRRTTSESLPEDKTIYPIGLRKCKPGTSVAGPSIAGMQVHYAVFINNNEDVKQEELVAPPSDSIPTPA